MTRLNTVSPENKNGLLSAIENAELIIIGAGKEFSETSGVSYDDPAAFDTLFPNYYERYGLRTVNEALSFHFASMEERYAFLARFIYALRYKYPAGKPYRDLRRLIGNKPYFALTTNTDSQFYKSGFAASKICSYNGDYMYFQCASLREDDIFYNEFMIKKMIQNIAPDEFAVRPEYIPRCPRCGSVLLPNVRDKGAFISRPWLEKYRDHIDLINSYNGKNKLLLELGTDMDSLGIIRYPFEQLTTLRKNTNLIRINRRIDHLKLYDNAENIKTIQADIGELLGELVTSSEFENNYLSEENIPRLNCA